MRRAALLAGLTLLMAGCSGAGPVASDARPDLGISNGTTMTVTLVVNDQPVATIAPGGPTPSIDIGRLPDLPWSVEARSPSGRVLTSMRVEPGSVTSTTRPSGVTTSTGTFGRVDLSCGSLRIWAGFPPSGPIPASPAGSPGDCVP